MSTSSTSTSTSPPPASADDEAERLDVARALLAAGDAAAAIGVLDDLAARAPHGALAEERAGLRVIALARAGRVDEAQAAARAFLAKHPQSLLAERVQRVLDETAP
jgi:hypothetical protein